MPPIQTLAVIGGGIMGTGIAELAILHDYEVLLLEQDGNRLQAALDQLNSRFAREVERGRLSEQQRDDALSHLRGSTSLEDVAGRDLVLEAIFEDLGAKQALFRDLGRICGPDTILASNTSSLSLSALAGASGRPDRVIGLHFFNPPTVLKLLEFITASTTSGATIKSAREFCDRLERVVVRVADSPGFIVNRLLIPFIFDAIRMVESGVATSGDIDQACRSGLGHAMGPLATADLIGLDTLAGIGDAMFEELGEPRFKPPTMVKRMISVGQLGRKTRSGFLTYDDRP